MLSHTPGLPHLDCRKNVFSKLNSLVLWLTAWVCFPVHAGTLVNHEFDIEIIPSSSAIKVSDTITLASVSGPDEIISFVLDEGLAVEAEGVRLDKVQPLSIHFTEYAQQSAVRLSEYQLTLSKDVTSFTLRYEGKINHTLLQPKEESARSFSQTAGVISPEGVFLAHSSHWYPVFSTDELVTFSMTIKLPQPWQSVSQGDKTLLRENNAFSWMQWQEKQPQDDIYITAGKYSYYEQAAGANMAMAYLLSPDQALAQKYLDATAQYLSMYSSLLGPYPYSKFALVENFWETGYGMPSFTLLGSRVIRFPFILTSSYPHEILHNWWGNSVYIDYESGNWAEGLTAYLADHLIKQQRGEDVEHRRSVLQKYTDYVNSDRDFPLTEFKSRHSSATEAVGYGKTLMMFHMLRQDLGDRVFVGGLRKLYKDYRFKMAGFKDVEKCFSDVAGRDLGSFFRQWVDKTGAPDLVIDKAFVESSNGGYSLEVDISQRQEDGDAYQLHLPYAVTVEGQSDAVQGSFEMLEKQQHFSLNLKMRPLSLSVDPQFDVFRRLDSREIPAALSQGFGAERALMVLPADVDAKQKAAYLSLANSWQQNLAGQIEIIDDRQLDQLPTDRSVWVLGWQNRFRGVVEAALRQQQVTVTDTQVQLGAQTLLRKQNAVIFAVRNPHNVKTTIVWLAADNEKAMPGLIRKLPHYRKYSYLAFTGDEPDNFLKGQWEVMDSPMTVTLTDKGKMSSAQSRARSTLVQMVKPQLKRQAALIELPPVFSQARMMADINYLAAPDMKGRGLGGKELDLAAQYIASEFEKAGLQAAGDHAMGYLQQWAEDVGPPLGTVSLKNVVAVLPGVNRMLDKQSIIISAHYDHLGLGWPDVHQGDEGKIHPGADDNASGVAVMLELARQIAHKWKPQRSIVFIAFTGEEAKHKGSRHYVQSKHRYPADQVFAVINLDTVGRLGKQPVTIFGTGSANELIHVFRGAGFVTGVSVNAVKNDFGASDQKPFLEAGIPAVQMFASAHSDFHRPTDTVDKIDAAGLTRVAAILKEAAEYLANREEPLSVTLGAEKTHSQETGSPHSGTSVTGQGDAARRVSLGTVPDFSYQGKGVRIDDVVAGSPAQQAHLKSGDIIVKLNNVPLAGLADMSKVLKTLQAGASVPLTYLRDQKEYQITVTVVAR